MNWYTQAAYRNGLLLCLCWSTDWCSAFCAGQNELSDDQWYWCWPWQIWYAVWLIRTMPYFCFFINHQSSICLFAFFSSAYQFLSWPVVRFCITFCCFIGNTQMTVNNQIVVGTLMNLSDNPTRVSIGQDWRETDITNRIPIIVTGNDFSTIYAPLIRDGRLDKFYWYIIFYKEVFFIL